MGHQCLVVLWGYSKCWYPKNFASSDSFSCLSKTKDKTKNVRNADRVQKHKTCAVCKDLLPLTNLDLKMHEERYFNDFLTLDYMHDVKIKAQVSLNVFYVKKLRAHHFATS